MSTTVPSLPPSMPPDDDPQHLHYMRLALSRAHLSPPRPTNFRVGACLVSYSPLSPATPTLLATGYTLECEGNTHAEQSCFIKLASQYPCPEDRLGLHLPPHTVLYTTMEPCNQRSVGNTSCVERILGLRREDGRVAIERVVVGVKEPETFVGVNEGRRRLEGAGIEVRVVEGLEEEILRVATAGHVKEGEEGKGKV